MERIKKDGFIFERLLFAIRDYDKKTINFDSINLLYKIFAIKKIVYEEKLNFLGRFIIFGKKEFKFPDLFEILIKLAGFIDPEVKNSSDEKKKAFINYNTNI